MANECNIPHVAETTPFACTIFRGEKSAICDQLASALEAAGIAVGVVDGSPESDAVRGGVWIFDFTSLTRRVPLRGDGRITPTERFAIVADSETDQKISLLQDGLTHFISPTEHPAVVLARIQAFQTEITVGRHDDADIRHLPEAGDSVLGRYLLLDRISSTEQAAEFRARHQRTDELVRIRCAYKGTHDARQLMELNRLTNNFSHECVLIPRDAGEDANLVYAVFDSKTGWSLKKELDERGTIPFADAAPVIADVLAALAALTRAGYCPRTITAESVSVRVLDGRRRGLLTGMEMLQTLEEARLDSSHGQPNRSENPGRNELTCVSEVGALLIRCCSEQNDIDGLNTHAPELKLLTVRMTSPFQQVRPSPSEAHRRFLSSMQLVAQHAAARRPLDDDVVRLRAPSRVLLISPDSCAALERGAADLDVKLVVVKRLDFAAMLASDSGKTFVIVDVDRFAIDEVEQVAHLTALSSCVIVALTSSYDLQHVAAFLKRGFSAVLRRPETAAQGKAIIGRVMVAAKLPSVSVGGFNRPLQSIADALMEVAEATAATSSFYLSTAEGVATITFESGELKTVGYLDNEGDEALFALRGLYGPSVFDWSDSSVRFAESESESETETEEIEDFVSFDVPDDDTNSSNLPSPEFYSLQLDSNPHRPTCLIAEDDDDLREILAVSFERSGLDVLTAEDGAAARGLLRRHSPDVILSDLFMPVIDGWGLLAAVRSSPRFRDRPFILHSSHHDVLRSLRGARVGANQYIEKGASVEHVIDVVKRSVSLRTWTKAAIENDKLPFEVDIRRVGVASIVQWLLQSSVSARVVVVSQHARAIVETGAGRVHNANVMRGETLLAEEEAIQDILSWRDGVIRAYSSHEVVPIDFGDDGWGLYQTQFIECIARTIRAEKEAFENLRIDDIGIRSELLPLFLSSAPERASRVVMALQADLGPRELTQSAGSPENLRQILQDLYTRGVIHLRAKS